MEHPDIPMISSEEAAAPAPAPKLRLQASRKETPEMLASPRGREAMPTARIEVVRADPVEVAGHLETAAREFIRLSRERDEAGARANALEKDLGELRARGAESEQLKQAQAALQIENANLKTRVNELETLLRKRETALQNSKDEKDLLEKKLAQIKSALT